MEEIWKEFPLDTKVKVSSLGRVRSRLGRILKPFKSHNGYSCVRISVKGKATNFKVHRLVAITFLGLSDKKTVNHRDGDKLNNRIDNLEWSSHSENLFHATRVLGVRSGERSHLSKYDDIKIMSIITCLKAGMKKSNIAKELGVSPSLVCDIASKRAWNHLQGNLE